MVAEMVPSPPDLSRLRLAYSEWRCNPSRVISSAVEVASDAIHQFIEDNFFRDAPRSEVDDFSHAQSIDLDGEDVVAPVINSGLLLLAESILQKSDDCRAARLSLHCSVLHQAFLAAPSPSLLRQIEASINRLSSDEPDAHLALEIAIALIGSGQQTRAKPWIERAQAQAGLKMTLTGLMGKRTRFQKDDRAQLVVRIDSIGDSDATGQPFQELVDENLDDDTLLERIQFNNPDQDPASPLGAVPSAIMLAWAEIIDYENLVDDIKRMEQLAYLQHSLRSPVWSVRLRTLLRRSLLEGHDIHYRIRSLRQLESLVSVASSNDSGFHCNRFRDFFLSLPIPVVGLKLALAKQQEQMLLNSSALSIYMELDIWEAIMRLQVKLGRSAEAQILLKERMERDGPSPRLQCIMGDVTMDPEWYRASWELSHQRYSRAQRSLAERSFTLQQWHECIDHYRLALAINPIFPDAWFKMGYAALQLKDYQTAAMAFSRSVNLRPDDGDAQNNLAAAYLETKQMPLAFQALKACVRLKSGEWKVWDNYLTAAMGISDLQAAVHGFTKVLELQKSHIDAQLLKSLCDAVLQCPDDKFLHRRTRELLLDICNQVADNADVFGVASEFFASAGELELASDFCYKQCLVLENPDLWLQSPSSFVRLVQNAAEFVRLSNFGQKSRLLLRRIVSNTEKFPDLPTASVEVVRDLLSKCSPLTSFGSRNQEASDFYSSEFA